MGLTEVLCDLELKITVKLIMSNHEPGMFAEERLCT